MNNLKKRCLTLLLSLAMIVTYMPVSMITAYAAAGETPDAEKSIRDNGDGTYTLSLDIVGESEVDTENTKANIVVILDRSGSMRYYVESDTGRYGSSNDDPPSQDNYYGNNRVTLYTANGTEITNDTTQGPVYTRTWNGRRWVYTEYTGKRYANELRMATAKGAINDLVTQMQLYNAQVPNTVQMALVSFSDRASTNVQMTGTLANITNAINATGTGAITPDGGTNWEEALSTARTIARNADDDPTYVIFVTDGNPTRYGTGQGTGYETDDNINTSYERARDDARNIVNDGFTLYNLGVFGSVDRMENLTTYANGATSPNKGKATYYSVTNKEDLNKAFAEIIEQISENIGITDVDIKDGTTSTVTTSSGVAHLLEVVPNSFKYYRSGGDYGDMKEWTSTDDPAPPAAGFNSETGQVEWDLSTIGVLENNVKYTVTFDVYPSQETYDLIAQLKNGDIKYSDVDPAIQQYISDGSYSLRTNTSASYTWTDTREENPTEHSENYVNPDPVATSSESLPIKKTWEGGNPDVDSVPITVMMGNTNFHTATLTADNNWETSTFISVGIIKDGQALPGAMGHDFSFAELDDTQYHWEIDAPVVRPMLINGGGADHTPTMLIKVDEKHPAPSGATKYTIDGSTYYVDESITGLTATNHRRSNLNLTKTVTGEDAPKDATFPFTLTVNNALAPATEPTDDPEHGSDYWVWFSIYDTKAGATVTDATISGATGPNADGYYYAKSGTAISVQMKDGWNLRFTNLPSDTTYTFVEGNLADGFELKSAELTQGVDTTFHGGQTTTGTIQETKTSYYVEYTNDYALTNLEITKVWNDANNQDGKRLTADQLKAKLTLSPAVEGKEPTVTDNGDNTYTITYTGLPRYSNGTEVEYTVTESEITGYTTTGSPAKDHGTITNTHTPSKIDIPVKKIWNDNNNQDGKRTNSVTINLLADGQPVEGKTLTLNEGNNWSGTFTDLPEKKNGTAIAYTIQEATVPTDYTATYGTDTDGKTLTVTNSHTPETRGYLVSKTWDDENDQDGKRPASIQVNLLKNGSVYKTVTLNAENDWQYAWVAGTENELPKYENGTAISYSAEEVTPDGSDHLNNYNAPTYQHTGNGAERTATAITNSRGVDKTTYTIKKVWDDANNQDGLRPDHVMVQLYADGTAHGDAVRLDASNDWQHTWTGLDVNRKVEAKETSNTSDDTANTAEDTEKRSAAPESGTVEAAESGDAAPEAGAATAEETVENADEEGSTDTVESEEGSSPEEEITEEPAKAEEKATEEPAKEEASEEPATEEAESNDAAVKASGEDRAIVYTAEEDPVPTGYTASYGKDPEDESVNVVTNKHVPETQTLDVTKIWSDDSNRDGIRPAGVTFTVTGSDGNTYTATLEKPDGATVNTWTATIQNVAKYYNEGTLVTFTVDENEVANYTKSIDNSKLTITNSHTTQKKNIDVSKIWDDAEDQDGKRPAEITVQLIGMVGQTVVSTAEAVLNAANNWKYTFADVLVNYNGQPITYIINEIVSEATSKEYTSSGGAWTAASGKHEGEFTTENGAEVKAGTEGKNDNASITNTHKTEKEKITVTKIWDDNSDMDGKRPESVKFTVTGSDGKTYETTLTNPAGAKVNTWTSEIEVEKYYNHGEEVTFTVDEEDVDNYTKSIDNSKLTITNTRDAGHLKVTKKVVSDKAADKDLAFNFTVTLDDNSISGTFGDMTFENGVATFTLKHGDTMSATGIPEGVGYVVTEEAEGFTVEKTGDEGTIGKGTTSTAAFTNTREKGSLEVKKTVVSNLAADANKEFEFTVTLSDTSISGTYGGMSFTNGVATFKLKGGDKVTATGLPTTVEYTVKEKAVDGFTTTPAEGAEGEISTTASSEEFTNTRETGDLEVSKTVKSDLAADKDATFTFTITLDDKTISGKYGDMTFDKGVATVTLKGGEKATATGLPTTVGYKVEEAAAAGFTTEPAEAAEGTITKTKSTEAFTNTRVQGGLKVTKTVSSDKAADKNVEFQFTVTLNDNTISGKYGDMEFAEGVATFKLKDGAEAVATGLPTTVGYTVTEETAEGFTTKKTGNTGSISSTQAVAAFTNTRETGDLEVSKTVKSDLAADKDATFTFTITLDDKTISGKYGDMTFDKGVATVTLKGGEKATATGLPTTVGYKVEEAAAAGFTTEPAEAAEGTITKAKSTEAFTNTRKTGDLEVTKTVVSDKAADKSTKYNFTVTLGDTSISGDYGDMTFTDGVATFALADGESAKAEGLPDSVTYTVAETAVDGLAPTYDSNTGAIAADETAQSNFTNTRAKGGLIVTKTVDSKLTADADKEFEFTVTLDEPVTGTYGEMTFNKGVATFKLKGGDSKTAEGLPTSVGYTVTETAADGFTTEKSGDTGTINATKAATAAFTNTREVGNLTVKKTVSSDKAADKTDVAFSFKVELTDKKITGTFGGMTFTNGVAEFTLKHNETKTATGLPTTVGYTVTETPADGFKTEKSGDTGSISKTASTAAFTNTRETGDLEVSKTVVSDLAADATKEFEFTVTLSDTTINGVYGGMTFTNGVATFPLTSGAKATATGLPTTVTYTVTETPADGFTTTPERGAEGTISKTKSTAEFTNTRKTGGLEVTKTVDSVLAADKNVEFEFTVELADKTINGKYGDMTFKDGVATFKLKGGEKATATKLPTTVGYTVTEKSADGFVTKKTGDTGAISVDGSTAAFTNTRETGDLEVTKTVVSPQTLDNNVEFEFKVTLADKTISGTYGDMTFDKGVATFKLKHGAKATATGLPTTLTYTVEETALDGFTTTKTGDTGSISKTKSTAAFTNTAETTKLTANKIWDDANNQDGYRPEKVTFTLTGTAGETKVYENTQEVAVAKDGKASYTWENLTTHYNGTKIDYVVTEAKIDHYTAEVGELTPVKEGDKVTGYTVDVTNTHAPAKTKVTVLKKWDDLDNYDNRRPENVTVTLLDGGKPVAQEGITAKQTLDEKGNWTYTWEGLDLYRAGEKIDYTVEEDHVEGYETSIYKAPPTQEKEDDADSLVYNVTVTNKILDVKAVAKYPSLIIGKADQDGVALNGVQFQLENGDQKSKIYTIENGSTTIDFEDLGWLPADERTVKEGDASKTTYTFKLVELPKEGYDPAGPWDVEVKLNGDAQYKVVKVVEEGVEKESYWERLIDWIINGVSDNPNAETSFDGEKVVFNVTNKASAQKVVVTKEFAGVDALPDSFAINVEYTDYNAEGRQTTKTALVTDASKITDKNVTLDTDGNKYTWTIDNVRYGTEVKVLETGYTVPGYSVEATAEATAGEKTASGTATGEDLGLAFAKLPAAAEGEAAATFDFSNTYTHINLEINKTIDELVSYDSDAEVKDATFTFRIVGKDAEGKEVLNTVASVLFNASTGKSDKVTIEKIPPTVATIEVTEIDPGNYMPDAVKINVDVEKLEVKDYTKLVTVSFDNTQNGNDYKSGAINKYEKSGTGYVKAGSGGTQTTEGGAGDNGQN